MDDPLNKLYEPSGLDHYDVIQIKHTEMPFTHKHMGWLVCEFKHPGKTRRWTMAGGIYVIYSKEKRF